MLNEVEALLESYNKVNGSAISVTRCVILALLSYFVDGIQYRELKTALNISDGKLIANLNKLREMKYIEKFEAQIDNSKIDVYVLTSEGKAGLNKIIEWMDLIKKVVQDGGKCQLTLT